MKIAVIQAASCADKNPLLYKYARMYAKDAAVYDFGCFSAEEGYSYIEIALLTGLLLASGAIDLVITGCSSGQGMMLACNSMPGVLCGYLPAPRDAFLFGRINNGNAVSLPLGDGYTYAGEENLRATLEALFTGEFGAGWPEGSRERKQRDTRLLKELRALSQVRFIDLLQRADGALVRRALTKRDVVSFVLEHGTDAEIRAWLEDNIP